MSETKTDVQTKQKEVEELRQALLKTTSRCAKLDESIETIAGFGSDEAFKLHLTATSDLYFDLQVYYQALNELHKAYEVAEGTQLKPHYSKLKLFK